MMLAGLVAACAIGAGIYVASKRDRGSIPPSNSVETSAAETTAQRAATTPTTTPSARASAIAAAGGDAAARDDHDRLAELRSGLASNDEATRIAAVEAAVSATAVETLPELEKFDLAKDPETAPTVIHGVALLGASADGAKRDEAAKTLSRWLGQETHREGADVPGNVSNLVEALGDVGGQQAVDALTATLDKNEVPLHVQTLAVQKLGELGDGRARGAVERFAARAAALPAADGIDEELRVEAIDAARDALKRI